MGKTFVRMHWLNFEDLNVEDKTFEMKLSSTFLNAQKFVVLQKKVQLVIKHVLKLMNVKTAIFTFQNHPQNLNEFWFYCQNSECAWVQCKAKTRFDHQNKVCWFNTPNATRKRQNMTESYLNRALLLILPGVCWWIWI